MGKFTLLPFDKSHASYLMRQGIRDSEIFLGVEERVEQMAECHAQNGIGFTLIVNDKIIGCGGVDIVNGEGMAWLLLSPIVVNYKKTVLRTTKETLDAIIKQEKLKVVYALVSASDVAAQAWANALDFIYQPSVKKVAGPGGKEYLTYRRAV